MMKVLKLLLYPLAALFNLGAKVRNYLYDSGQKPSTRFSTTVIAVGNLNVGGSGKTPMVEYLIRLLKNTYHLTTLSRGYRRQSKGYRKAVGSDTALSLGDEPFQLFRKFGNEIDVVVGEDRALAIPQLLRDCPNTDVILMDDALQHRSVRAHLSILVTDFNRPFYKDFVLPFGRLRESRGGAARADIIVVTKCPTHSINHSEIRSRIAKYAPGVPVFFSRVEYGAPEALGSAREVPAKIILVTGIARAENLQAYCRGKFEVVKHFQYPDHHRYSEQHMKEISDMVRQTGGKVAVMTTEKDMVKLLEPEFQNYLAQDPWFYLPIRHEFLEDGPKFDALIHHALEATKNTD